MSDPFYRRPKAAFFAALFFVALCALFLGFEGKPQRDAGLAATEGRELAAQEQPPIPSALQTSSTQER